MKLFRYSLVSLMALLVFGCVNYEKLRHSPPTEKDLANIEFTYSENTPGVLVTYYEKDCQNGKFVMFRDRPNPKNNYQFRTDTNIGFIFRTGKDAIERGGWHCALEANFKPEKEKSYLLHFTVEDNLCHLRALEKDANGKLKPADNIKIGDVCLPDNPPITKNKI